MLGLGSDLFRYNTKNSQSNKNKLIRMNQN